MQRRAIAILMTLEAASLVVMSAIHLARSERNSGIPEAVICVVLALGAIAVYRATPRWRDVALGAVGFAIAGFLVGLSVTVGAGDVANLAYHATVLPLLVATFVLASRVRPLPIGTYDGGTSHDLG
jgi:hypothetical protein